MRIPFSAVGLLLLGTTFAFRPANWVATLDAIDVSDPAHPVVVATRQASGHVYDMAVAGDFLYAVGYVLQSIDISDPADPHINAGDVITTGDRAYLAAGDGGIEVLDIAKPESPTILGSETALGARAVAAAGSLAYLAGGWTGLMIFDVSQPGHPQYLGGLDSDGYYHDVAVSGGYPERGGVLALRRRFV